MTSTDASPGGRRLHLHDRIGSGGFGDVYRATLVSGGGVETLVAIKVLHKDTSPSSQALQRLRDEGKMLGLIRHPAIVKVLDMVALDGRAALVTEYVEGADLGFLMRRKALGPRSLVEAMGVVAGALNAAFNTMTASGAPLNLLHRDVKPENIRLGRHGDVKLLDFGIAKAGGIRREARTEAGDVVGSYRYMAPERLSRKREDRPEGDVFSLGAVLYEGLSGERLFHGLDLRDQVRLAGDAEAYGEFLRGRMAALKINAALRALLTAALEHDPTERPTALRFAAWCDELADVLEGPNLRQWCRVWDWPTEDAAPGPLTGKSIVDAPSAASMPAAREERAGITLMVFDDEPLPAEAPRPISYPPRSSKGRAASSAPPASDRPSARPAAPVLSAAAPGRFEIVLGAVTASAVAVLGAIGVGVLVAMVVYSVWREQDGGGATPAPEPAVPPPAAPAPVPDAPAPAEPLPAPPPTGSDPPPAPTPAPVGSATPTAAPEPADHAPGTLVLASRVPAELRGVAGSFGPGPVAVGAYVLVADFGQGMEPARTEPVVVLPGATITVRCTVLKRLCDVETVEAAPVP